MDRKILLGSDYDGTFRRSGDSPSHEDVEAVRRFKAAEGVFGIVTGRVPAHITDIFDKLDGICDFLLCSNGGICFMPDKSIAFSNEIPADDLHELYRICCECDPWYAQADIMSLTDEYSTTEELSRAFSANEDEQRIYLNGYIGSVPHCFFVKPEALKNIRSFTQFSSYFRTVEDTYRAMEMIEKAFPGKYECYCQGKCFDTTPAGVSKSSGLARVAEYFGVECENIYTAGDGWNDVDMLKAYNGIAMSGIEREIMDSAKWVFDSVGEAIHSIFELH